MLSAWASDLQDDMNVRQEGFGEVELKWCGSTALISVYEEDGDVDVLHLQWQVTFDTEHAPAFGLDMFDSDKAADVAAQKLHEEGRANIVLTMIEDDAPVQSWKFDADVQSWRFDVGEWNDWREIYDTEQER